MGIIIALIIGLIAGALAKLVMPGKDPGGLLVTMLLGIVGSVAAYFVGTAVGWYGESGDGPGVIASTVGALLVLGLYRVAVGRKTF